MAEITKKKSLDELKKELSDIQAESDAKKQAVYDNELKLEKIEYNAPTDDEIYNLAKSYIDQKYTSLQSDEKKKVEEELKLPNNRFVAGTPRVSDGQLLFLQNL